MFLEGERWGGAGNLLAVAGPGEPLGPIPNLQSLGVLPPITAVLSGDQAVSKRELENLSTHGSLKIILKLRCHKLN